MDEKDDSILNGSGDDDAPEPSRCGVCELAPADAFDPVVEAYKKDVDKTLLIENLKLTPAQRAKKFVAFMKFVGEVQDLGQKFLQANAGEWNVLLNSRDKLRQKDR